MGNDVLQNALFTTDCRAAFIKVRRLPQSLAPHIRAIHNVRCNALELAGSFDGPSRVEIRHRQFLGYIICKLAIRVVAAELLEQTREYIRLTRAGRLLADRVIRDFLLDTRDATLSLNVLAKTGEDFA